VLRGIRTQLLCRPAGTRRGNLTVAKGGCADVTRIENHKKTFRF
jgi:hypothetical protein